MKALLICPSPRPAVPLLSESAPLATAPLLGQSLLEYWLSWLACSGVKQVLILAHDRHEQVCALAGDGARWGLEVQVHAESRELAPAQALLKYAPELDPVPSKSRIALLDHLPGLPDKPLFTGYNDWFAALLAWMPHALTPDRVGVRQLRPGVWVGAHSRISPQAQLRAPCWVGNRVLVGARAVIGPHAMVEDGALIEPWAEVLYSHVGPHTLVGKLTHVANSLAWGNRLLNWRSGSLATVLDPFLLCALHQPHPLRSEGWLTRLSGLYTRNKEEVSLLWRHLLAHKGG